MSSSITNPIANKVIAGVILGIVVGVLCGIAVGQTNSQPMSIEITYGYIQNPDTYKSMLKTYAGVEIENAPANSCIALIKITTDTDVGVQINISQNLNDMSEYNWKWNYLTVTRTEPAGEGWVSYGPDTTEVFPEPVFNPEYTYPYFPEPTLNSNYSFEEKRTIILRLFGEVVADAFDEDPWKRLHLTVFVTLMPRESITGGYW